MLIFLTAFVSTALYLDRATSLDQHTHTHIPINWSRYVYDLIKSWLNFHCVIFELLHFMFLVLTFCRLILFSKSSANLVCICIKRRLASHDRIKSKVCRTVFNSKLQQICVYLLWFPRTLIISKLLQCL